MESIDTRGSRLKAPKARRKNVLSRTTRSTLKYDWDSRLVVNAQVAGAFPRSPKGHMEVTVKRGGVILANCFAELMAGLSAKN